MKKYLLNKFRERGGAGKDRDHRRRGATKEQSFCLLASSGVGSSWVTAPLCALRRSLSSLVWSCLKSTCIPHGSHDQSTISKFSLQQRIFSASRVYKCASVCVLFLVIYNDSVCVFYNDSGSYRDLSLGEMKIKTLELLHLMYSGWSQEHWALIVVAMWLFMYWHN